MNIKIHDAVLEARIQKLLQTTGTGTAEEALRRLLETQEETGSVALRRPAYGHRKD